MSDILLLWYITTKRWSIPGREYCAQFIVSFFFCCLLFNDDNIYFDSFGCFFFLIFRPVSPVLIEYKARIQIFEFRIFKGKGESFFFEENNKLFLVHHIK